MNTDLHVVVTGAAGGLGAAIAERFASQGARVTGVDLPQSPIVDTMKKLGEKFGCATHTVTFDLSGEDCGKVIGLATAAQGAVDVLVNAAGLYPSTPLLSMTSGAWDNVQNVNVRAPLLLTVALAEEPGPRSRPPVVVNISSGAAIRVRKGAAHYCASKAALESMTKSAALEFAPLGIRVNAVAPGFVPVASPINPVSDRYASAVSTNPLGRAGTPEEIASAVAYLASDEASFITGAVLRVDGGSSAGSHLLPLSSE